MEPLLLDPANAATRVEFGMAEAEVAQRMQWRASAEAFRAIDATMREAVAHPEIFVDEQMLRGDAIELAERAAVADLAVRLSLAESTVRAQGHVARTLRERLPRLWSWFLDGEVSTHNAREASGIVIELSAEHWGEFESRIVDDARTLAPARFRSRARVVREKLHAETLIERRQLAEARRGVWIEPDRDGMGWLTAYLPAEKLAMVSAGLDAAAFDLFTEHDEQRTMAQLRADVLVDLVTRAGGQSGPGSVDGTGSSGRSSVGVTVALTVPVLSLLGQSTEPAILEGIGPIDIETARRLCIDAPSFTRLLTDPITGTVLEMDARQYRPSAALRRWLGIRQVTCDFPGCGRRAANCDLDHTCAWAAGGQTTAANLTHRCRKHHTMKHQTKWRVDRPPGAERAVWTSPTGYARTADPPPF
jgi:hypothetical protein